MVSILVPHTNEKKNPILNMLLKKKGSSFGLSNIYFTRKF